MPISIEWDDDEHTIIRWTFEGAWTWHEFVEVQVEFRKLLDDITYRVNVIADMQNAHTLPANSLTTFKQIDSNIHPNRDRVVVVGANAFVRTMAATFDRVFPSKTPDFLFADSIEEARKTLR